MPRCRLFYTKIVQGERKTKSSELDFVFPNRSIKVLKVLWAIRKTTFQLCILNSEFCILNLELYLCGLLVSKRGPNGGIGRHEGLKIPWPERAVPVRSRLRVQEKERPKTSPFLYLFFTVHYPSLPTDRGCLHRCSKKCSSYSHPQDRQGHISSTPTWLPQRPYNQFPAPCRP